MGPQKLALLSQIELVLSAVLFIIQSATSSPSFRLSFAIFATASGSIAFSLMDVVLISKRSWTALLILSIVRLFVLSSISGLWIYFSRYEHVVVGGISLVFHLLKASFGIYVALKERLKSSRAVLKNNITITTMSSSATSSTASTFIKELQEYDRHQKQQQREQRQRERLQSQHQRRTRDRSRRPQTQQSADLDLINDLEIEDDDNVVINTVSSSVVAAEGDSASNYCFGLDVTQASMTTTSMNRNCWDALEPAYKEIPRIKLYKVND